MMNFNTWTNKKAFTLGAELEVRILDSKTFALKDFSSKLYKLISDDIKPFVHQEYLESMVEFVSPICNNAKETVASLQKYIKIVSDIGKEKHFVIATSGSYSPKVGSLKAIESPRYKKFKNEYGIVLDRFHICGFHIHVGLSSSDEALHVYNFMLDKLPLFLALSANSPYFDGKDTALQSYRIQLFNQLPRAGMPSYFDSYEQMQYMYTELEDAGVINSGSDLWWDVRISPKFGTLEIRICDASCDFERLEDLINLYQALCKFALTQTVRKLPHQILMQNKWNAARHGFEGIYTNKASQCKSIKEYFFYLIDKMKRENIFESLGIEDEFVSRLRNRASEELLSQKQRDIYTRTNDFYEIEKMGIIKC